MLSVRPMYERTSYKVYNLCSILFYIIDNKICLNQVVSKGLNLYYHFIVQSFDIEPFFLRFFQKRAVRTKFDIMDYKSPRVSSAQ